MGDNEMSALKCPRTRVSDQSLDMLHSYVELEPHRRLRVGSDRFPPAVCMVAMARAGENRISDGHFSHTGRVGGWRWFCATQKKPRKTKQNSNGITTLISSRMAEIQCLQNKQGPLETKTKISKMQGTSQAKHGVVMEKSGWHEGGPDTDRVFKSRGVGGTY